METEKIITTKNLGYLKIKLIAKEIAKKIIIENHYSHKWNNGSFGVYNFGIFQLGKEDENQCLGVAVYGYMKNCKAKIFTHSNPKGWIIELNRMWIDDCLGKNAESLLIAHSLKMLKKIDKNILAVQSFADGRLGCGTIYKASNFKYYGLHYTKFLRNKRTDEVVHEQNFSDTTCKSAYLRNNVSFILGDFEIFRVKTYRYIYIFDKGIKLKFKEKPYPPYDKGLEYIKWSRDTNKIIRKMVSLLDTLKVE